MARGLLTLRFNCGLMFSTDGGHTWIGAGKDRGFLVDNTYGYSRNCLMPDGSPFVVYIATGGARPHDAANNDIWSIRLRVREDHSGIERLPVDDTKPFWQ